jgi:hypothetical protein
MIPQLITVRIRRARGRRLRLWIPLVPLALLLSPLLLLAVLAAVVACLVGRINPVRALHAVARLLCALPGTRVEFEQGPTAVALIIR